MAWPRRFCSESSDGVVLSSRPFAHHAWQIVMIQVPSHPNQAVTIGHFFGGCVREPSHLSLAVHCMIDADGCDAGECLLLIALELGHRISSMRRACLVTAADDNHVVSLSEHNQRALVALSRRIEITGPALGSLVPVVSRPDSQKRLYRIEAADAGLFGAILPK